MSAPVDRDGMSAEDRFAEIRKFFLAWLADSGHARTELYRSPKLGQCEPTEEEVVRQWANDLNVRLNDVLIGIQNAFGQGKLVTSFRYCVPQIVARVREMAESRVGSGD